MALKTSVIKLTTKQQEELDRFVLRSGWRVVSGTELPNVFPETFKTKIDSALVISTPTSTGGTYLVYSANRVDWKDRAIDIEPFGVIVHSTGPSSWGIFVHHGDWPARTSIPPPQVWDEAVQSRIGNYFLTCPPEGRREGTLDELPPGHRGAFEVVVRKIRARVDGEEK